ncbi:Sir2 silent information regulator family NAD-dependent deacetylase [Terrisporobacter sp.]
MKVFLLKCLNAINSKENINNLSRIKSTVDDKDVIKIKPILDDCDAILIGAGCGLLYSAGLTYFGKRFEENFADFIEKYNMSDMYLGGYYPFDTEEEKWAYWSRHILINRYNKKVGKPYIDLLNLVKDKDYFVINTNANRQFQLAGFSQDKIFDPQGNYGLFQCKKACQDKLYDNEKIIKEMVKSEKDCKIPTHLVPKCPKCGGEMEVNIRRNNYFVQDNGWYESEKRYKKFIRDNRDRKIVFLELGVSITTPAIIKYPFWKMTEEFENAYYICINKGEGHIPREIEKKSIYVNSDIGDFLDRIKIFQS